MSEVPIPNIEDVDVGGQWVLVRGDLNVPLADGEVTDDFRLQMFLPTLEYLFDSGARTIICSHLGRPSGPDPALRMRPVAQALGELTSHEITPVPEVAGRVADAATSALQPGHAIMLENLRFDPGETENDDGFVQRLASLAQVYINDAFGACHRAHASVVGVPRYLPSAAGFLLLDEIEKLSKLLEEPRRPLVVVLGGAKVGDKLGVVRSLLERADRVLIGGGMCFTFLRARGGHIGRSLVDETRLDDVRAILDGPGGDKIVLPTDVIAADSIDAAGGHHVPATDVPGHQMGVDIGEASAYTFADEIRRAGTVFWNGPMGVFENDAFVSGTRAVADAVARADAFTVTGGGDTAAALSAFGLDEQIDFLSTGGGASLEFLEGKTLPGIAALEANLRERMSGQSGLWEGV